MVLENGYYWVKPSTSDWEIMRWDGHSWWVGSRSFVDRIVEIDKNRIERGDHAGRKVLLLDFANYCGCKLNIRETDEEFIDNYLWKIK